MGFRVQQRDGKGEIEFVVGQAKRFLG